MRKKGRRAGQKVLSFVCFLGRSVVYLAGAAVLVLAFAILIGGFNDHRFAQEMVHRTLTDASQCLQMYRTSSAPDVDVCPLDRAYLDQLRDESIRGLRSSDISFLFTICSLFIVSASVAALVEARKRLDSAKRYAKMGRNAASAMTISGQLTTCHDLAIVLFTTSKALVKQECLSLLRQDLRTLRRGIENAERNRVGIDGAQRGSFRDIAVAMCSRVRSLPYQGEIADVVEDCEAVVELFRDTPFDEWFDEELGALDE